MFFVVPGLIWFTLAGVMVLSLASAAQGSMPQPELATDDGAPRARFHPSPEVALDDTADQRALLNTPAPVNPTAPAPESIPEKANVNRE